MISAALNVASGVMGAISQNKQIDKQIKAQREENEKARQFNRESAELANRWSIEQWNRENAYNTPAAVRQRLREGGVNPDLFYGQGSQNLASASPTVSQTAPTEPTDVSAIGNKQTVGDVWSNVLQNQLVESQFEKAVAETDSTKQKTENLKVEGKILSADALTRAAQNEATLEFTKTQVYVNHSIAELNHSEKEKISAEITELNAKVDSLYQGIEESKAVIRNLNAKTAQARYDMYMRSKEFKLKVQEFQQMVKESDSRIVLNYEQARDYLATRSARILNLNTDTSLKSSQVKTEHTKRGQLRASERASDALANKWNIDAEQASFNLDSDKSYKNLERGVKVAKDVVSIFTDVANSAANFVKGTGFGKLSNEDIPRLGRNWH
nr:MAG TPA: DNA pilot protein VP2 [Bacteriophage sp.]